MSHQTFWKPEKKEKVKQQYNSLQARKPKEKKEQPEWKRGILSHHLSKPSKADRAEFPREVVAAAIERSNGVCQCCKQVPCTTLKAGEIRLIDGMDDREVAVFAKLMADVVSTGIDPVKPKGSYGYGHFED